MQPSNLGFNSIGFLSLTGDKKETNKVDRIGQLRFTHDDKKNDGHGA